MIKAYEWQKEAFNRFKDLKAFMLHCACGSGKSFAAIKIALYKKLPVLVIAPKNLCSDTWPKELAAAGVPEQDIWVYDQPTYSKDKAAYEKEFLAWLKS